MVQPCVFCCPLFSDCCEFRQTIGTIVEPWAGSPDRNHPELSSAAAAKKGFLKNRRFLSQARSQVTGALKPGPGKWLATGA